MFNPAEVSTVVEAAPLVGASFAIFAGGAVVGKLFKDKELQATVARQEIALDNAQIELVKAGEEVAQAKKEAHESDIARREAEERAHRDDLTGMLNRHSFIDAVEIHKAHQSRHPDPAPGVVMVADIDHFKLVNDTRGHNAGDRVLQIVAHAIKDSLRAGDIAARWGGEEFVILATEIDIEDSVVLADRLREKVKEDSGESISIGIAPFDEKEDWEQLLESADKALYQAKNTGRDKVVTFDLIDPSET